MKRKLLAALAAAASVVGLAGCIIGIPTDQFPAIRHGLQARIGQGSVCLKMNQGWYNGLPVWYINWDTNKIKQRDWNSMSTVTPYPEPKLNSALVAGAAPLYVVTNFNNQLPILSTRPDRDDYSGLWRIYQITWKKGSTPRFITSVANLPGPGEADIVPTDTVVNCPVMAIGPLTNVNSGVPCVNGGYRIKQALCIDVREKIIELPSWASFGQDQITRTILQNEILITDTGDPQLAELLQCNYAPGINKVPDTDTQKLWIFDWTQIPGSPPGQLPIMEETLRCDNFGLNINYNYSPIMDLIVVRRNSTQPNFVINNQKLLLQQIMNGDLTAIVDNERLNVLLINSWKWTNTCPSPGLGNMPF